MLSFQRLDVYAVAVNDRDHDLTYDRELALAEVRIYGLQLLDGKARDARVRWALLAPREQLGDLLGRALGLELDRTIAAILDPADDAEPCRLFGGGAPKGDTLHPAADDRANSPHPCSVPHRDLSRLGSAC